MDDAGGTAWEVEGGEGEGVSTQRDVVARWGGNPTLLERGFTPVVTSFLMYAAQLPPAGLSPTEVTFVLHLISFKWSADAPYPSYARLAQRMGLSVVYVRKLAQGLERRGLLRRGRRQGETNRFDLQPLFDRLADVVASRRGAGPG